MRWIVLTLLPLGLWGCSTSMTETGYEARKLGMGEAQLKGLYAPKYSPEAAQAQAERENQARSRSTPSTGLFR